MSGVLGLKVCAGFYSVLLLPLATAQLPGQRAKQQTCADTELKEIVPRVQRPSPGVERIQAKQSGEVWTWVDRSGCRRTRTELNDILAQSTPDKPADLSGTGLIGAPLAEADLTGADLNGAILRRANLSKATLSGAHLQHADLWNANLEEAHLDYSDLTGADLGLANLRQADLTDAELSGANFGARQAGFTTDPKTGNVRFFKRATDLRGTIFEPKSLPPSTSLVDNLEFVTYENDPSALVKFRKQLQDTGFREEERAITYALYKRRADLSWGGCYPTYRLSGHAEALRLWQDRNYATLLSNCFTYGFNTLLFDIPSDYGLWPGKSLILVGCLWAVCSLLYVLFIHLRGRSGLYRLKKRGLTDKEATMVLQIRPRRINTRSKASFLHYVFGRELRIARTAMFFSLMSAFNLGFHEIDFGRWLRLLTKREYDIKAVGAARAVSGWQSLISLYLVALWILTYFGRPFE